MSFRATLGNSGLFGLTTVGAQPSKWRDAVIATGTGIVVLLASLVNFLQHNEYPLLRAEVGLVVLLFVAVAVAIGLFYATLPNLGRSLLEAVLVFLALDVNFGGIVAIVGTAVIALVLKRRMLPFLGIAASVVLVSGLVGFGSGPGSTQASQARPAPGGSNAPVLVHIILDEHIGIEGMLRDGPEVLAMREKLKSFYLRNGFRLFGGAYSQYLHTINAIPQILNFGVQQPRSAFSQGGSNLTVNAYFDALGARGYRIHVSQTDFLNYCENASVVSCRTRRAADAHDLVDASIPASEKSRLLVNEMIKLSRLMKGAVASYDLIGFGGRYLGLPVPLYRLDTHRMPTAIGALESMDWLTGELRHAQPGNAYFMHELLPHYPYVMDGECRLKETGQWYNRRASDVVKVEREAGYFDQISCLLTKLDALLQALASSPAGANAIVVLHGDHGSRITDIDAKIETESSFADSDLVTGYATLFAVHAPGIAPGYELRRLPAAKLLDAIVKSDFHSAEVALPPGFVHSVMLENIELEPVREYPLPAWWLDSE